MIDIDNRNPNVHIREIIWFGNQHSATYTATLRLMLQFFVVVAIVLVAIFKPF